MSGQDARATGDRIVELNALRASMERALEADGMTASHAAETFDHPHETELDTIWLAAQYDFGLDGRMVCLSGDESVVLVDGEGTPHSSPVTGPIDRDALLAALTMTFTGGIDASSGGRSSAE